MFRSAIVRRLHGGACLIAVDADGIVRRWTRDAEVVFGYARERAEGLHIEQLAPFFTDFISDMEGWCRRFDGTVFRGAVAALSIDDELDRRAEHVCQVFVVTDITSRYMREQALQRVSDRVDEAPASFELDLWGAMAGTLVAGHRPRIAGASLEITPRRAVDAALRTSEAKLQAVLDATIDGILTIDAGGAIESVNQTASRMFRAPDTGLLGVQWNMVLDVASDALPSSGTLQEAVGRRTDGSTFAMECGFTEIGAGAQRLSIVVMRDVTQRRVLERQVLDVSEQLQRQIGQDLHDGLGQLLTGTAFLAKGLQHNLAAEHQPQAQRIVELINLAIARVRSLARGLSPIHIEAESLEAALRSTANEAAELLAVSCELKLDGFVERVGPAAIAHLCLIAREAITNAVRHGHARHIVVRLSRQAGQSALSVEDDGVGIDQENKPLEGLGLRNMRYRAKLIDGKLDIQRTRNGTTVSCHWRDP
jgi:PAS domain S-box-containing protein